MPFLSPRRLATAGVLGAIAALVAAPAALAGTASVDSDGVPRYQAKLGEDNGLFVAETPHPTNPNVKIVTFRDVVRVDAGPGCSSDPPFVATCNVSAGTGLVRAAMEDIADRLAPDTLNPLTTMGFSSHGDGGSDKLIGTLRRDVFNGDDGHDTLIGAAGNDGLVGEAGNDSLYGDDDNDSLDGGVDNDGLYGGDGDDAIYGGPGEDAINGGAGNDYIHAGIHNDQVIGGTGDDLMYGYYGDDTINADDNQGGDHIDCGPGYDKAIFDDDDTVNASNCEVLQPS
jgi:hypothetical protein